MRIIIYGAGGIGCVIGGHLAIAGFEVGFIGRPGHVDKINSKGLRLITPGGVHELMIPAVTHPRQIEFTSDDVIFLCMKGQDTEKALQELSALSVELPVFCIQNGVRNEEIAAEYFKTVYGAMISAGAVYLEEGEVKSRREPPGWIIMGEYSGGNEVLLTAVKSMLRDAGFLVMATHDVIPYKWGKLMLNVGNSVIAITDARRSEAEIIINEAQKELLELLKAADIKWKSMKDLIKEWPEIENSFVASLNVNAHCSSWQSLKRKQGSVETEFLNGEVVRLAKKLGRVASVNEKLIQIMQEMAANCEEPGKYTIAELARELGIEH